MGGRGPPLLEFFETPMRNVDADDPCLRNSRVPTLCGCELLPPEPLLKPAMNAGVVVSADVTSNARE